MIRFIALFVCSFFASALLAQTSADFDGWKFLPWESEKTSAEEIIKNKGIEVQNDFGDIAYARITRFKLDEMNVWLYFDSLNQLNKIQQEEDFSVIYLDEANAFYAKVKASLIKDYGVPQEESHDTSTQIIHMVWNLRHTKLELTYDYKYKIIDEFGCCAYKITVDASPIKNKVVPGYSVQASEPEYQLVYKGQLLELYVEKAIYEAPGQENFLMKFQIKNISSKSIGADLSNYWRTIYPNQWGIYSSRSREVVNEQQIIPDAEIEKSDLKSKFRKKQMVMIKPGETTEYFRNWNGSGEKPELNNWNSFFIITMDGQLYVTDGKIIEQVTLLYAEENFRAVVLSYPIYNRIVPENALIIGKY